MKQMIATLKIPVEVFSGVVGYYRPVNQCNMGKQQEFSERRGMRFEEIKP